VLNGSAAEPQLLSSENIEATDVFCALTNNDESNIMMSMLAKRMGAKKVITLIANPGALQVLDFAEGKVQLVAVRAYHGGPIVGQELQDIRKHMPKVDTRVAAIFRQDRSITPEGSTVVKAGDEIFFIAARKNIRARPWHGI